MSHFSCYKTSTITDLEEAVAKLKLFLDILEIVFGILKTFYLFYELVYIVWHMFELSRLLLHPADAFVHESPDMIGQYLLEFGQTLLWVRSQCVIDLCKVDAHNSDIPFSWDALKWFLLRFESLQEQWNYVERIFEFNVCDIFKVLNLHVLPERCEIWFELFKLSQNLLDWHIYKWFNITFEVNKVSFLRKPFFTVQVQRVLLLWHLPLFIAAIVPNLKYFVVNGKFIVHTPALKVFKTIVPKLKGLL